MRMHTYLALREAPIDKDPDHIPRAIRPVSVLGSSPNIPSSVSFAKASSACVRIALRTTSSESSPSEDIARLGMALMEDGNDSNGRAERFERLERCLALGNSRRYDHVRDPPPTKQVL